MPDGNGVFTPLPDFGAAGAGAFGASTFGGAGAAAFIGIGSGFLTSGAGAFGASGFFPSINKKDKDTVTKTGFDLLLAHLLTIELVNGLGWAIDDDWIGAILNLGSVEVAVRMLLMWLRGNEPYQSSGSICEVGDLHVDESRVNGLVWIGYR